MHSLSFLNLRPNTRGTSVANYYVQIDGKNMTVLSLMPLKKQPRNQETAELA